MTSSDFTLIAPLVAALLVAGAVVLVDAIAPGRDRPVTAVALVACLAPARRANYRAACSSRRCRWP